MHGIDFSMIERKKKTILLFLGKFSIIAVLLYLLEFAPIATLQIVVANAVAWLLNATGVPATLSGTLISLPGFAGFISWDCVGWKSMVALFALITATPLYENSRFWGRKRLYGYALLVVVFVLNVFRVWLMFSIAYANTDAYFALHDIIWSFGLIIAVLVLWVFWYKYL